MTVLLWAVVLVIAVVAITLITARARGRPEGDRAPRAGEWLDRARDVVLGGRRLLLRVSTMSTGRALPELGDEELDVVVAAIDEFVSTVAPISATAPTVMDSRVSREVGVRARALGEVFEREVRQRRVLGDEPRPGFGVDVELEPSLAELDVALTDLENHVELL